MADLGPLGIPRKPRPPGLNVTPGPFIGPTVPQGANAPPGSTPFGPDSNLIGTQLNTTPAADTAAARGEISSQYGKFAGMPDRRALAEQEYNALATLDNANLGRDIQGAGQRAAQFGKLGSGMVTAETGDIFGQHRDYLAKVKSDLATSTAGQMTQDQLNRLSAAQGVTGQLSGLDDAAYGKNYAERGYQAGESQQAYDNALAAAGLTSPNPLATQIAGTYGQQGSAQMTGAGNTLAQLFAMSGKRPYAYGNAGVQTTGYDQPPTDLG